MFKWFKRRDEAPAAARQARQARQPGPAGRPAAPRPAPAVDGVPPVETLPEVVGEGNTQADWSAWEDSMTALDSQLQGLAPSSRFQVRDTRPSQLDDLDPFASVRGKRDV